MLLLFIISFLMFIYFISCCVFIHIFFSTRSLTFALGFLHPILYFQPKPSRSDSRHFVLRPFQYLLAAGASVLRGHYLPTGAFYLGAFTGILTCVCVYRGFSRGSSSLGFAGLHSYPRIAGPAHLLV